MGSRNNVKGFTLVEVMVVMAIIAILGAVAIPVYIQYNREAEVGTSKLNMGTLQIYIEDYALDNGMSYAGASGIWTADESVTTLRDIHGWTPSGDNKQYNYTVVAEADTYSIVVENPGAEVWVRCEDRMGTCCSSETPGATILACP
ncbi:MAG: prepilin-type N-terminal cleavage/methylation domain-containing protein [Candidatus Thiodiazotropha sp. (ex Monitilora ramsayi)]|nr:prepilin-type N-terminal cleavage/methylation domain-containing protein [Candidatus Thiodiazotropha sp. (ex Monitilora ramsayi)]